MPHWTDAWIGRPYIPGVADCASLIEEVAVSVLGIHPGLPVTHETTLRGQASQVARLKGDYAVRVDEPVEAHPVMFVARGRFFHFGAVTVIDGETWVLHNSRSAGRVVCERLRDMAQWSYSLEGFYRWLATS